MLSTSSEENINREQSIQQKSLISKSPTQKSKTKPLVYPEYISRQEVEEGLRTGQLIKGIIRINPKFTKHSYVENEDPSKPDFRITSFFDRNRALDSDEVILKVKDNLDNEEKEMEVVYITKMVHFRTAVGYLKPIENNKYFALLLPRDKRFPIIDIHKTYWPKDFGSHPTNFENVLFLARISKWNRTGRVQGQIIENLGMACNLKAENLAILREFCLHLNTHNTPLLRQTYFFKIEFPREDLRRRCVFTIDNPETKYMDDALSWQELPNGNYELGIHISDVSNFLSEGSELDKIARRKATSIYLIDTAYHMLSNELSSLCSLEPGKDKFTFSVFFEITRTGEIKNTRGSKSVINSCVQLTYEQAQMFIDEPNKVFNRDELPLIYSGFTPQDLSKSVNILQQFSLMLKEYRRKKYGVRSHEESPSFRLDHVTGEPTAIITNERIPAQELVEEFMIFANVAVAEKIYYEFPDLALLRVHRGPYPKKISNLKKRLETIGFYIDTSSSKNIEESLLKYTGDKYLGKTCGIVLRLLINKCLQKESYVCSGTLQKGATFAHFGLGFPVYTHFTSPLRRYGDVVVHRLLSASLRYRPKPQIKTDDVSNIASHCNHQESQAKKAAKASFDLYLSYYIENHQPFIEHAVVYKVNQESIDVIVFNTQISVRIYTNTFEEDWSWKSEKIDKNDEVGSPWKMTITFPETKSQPQTSLVVDIFTILKVKLFKASRVMQLKANLCRL